MRTFIRQKDVHFLRSRRQTRQVKRCAAADGGFISFRRGFNRLFFQSSKDKVIDLIPRPFRILNLRHRGPLGFDVGPVLLPFGSLGNPAREQVDLRGSQFFARIRRRHQFLRVLVGDAFDQFALGNISRDDSEVAGLGRF